MGRLGDVPRHSSEFSKMCSVCLTNPLMSSMVLSLKSFCHQTMPVAKASRRY